MHVNCVARTCRNAEEFAAVFGEVDDNSFVKQMRDECARNLEQLSRLRATMKA